MIKTIIFDFGNVFINLDIEGANSQSLKALNIETFTEDIIAYNALYEEGFVTTDEFLEFYTTNFPHISKNEFISLWNIILKDFPDHRLEFLKQLKASGNYKLILLSNTNEIHIDWIKRHIGFYDTFKNCFDAFYLSHDIHLRKPNTDIYKFVLNQNDLNPNECLFIDDNTDNTKAAETLGIHTWNINPDNEDVCNLFETKKDVF